MEELSKLEKIEQIFIHYDHMKKISKMWSSNDEYNSEALQLAASLNRQDTALSIQRKIWFIFYDRYCFVTKYVRGRQQYTKLKLSDDKVIAKIGLPDKYFDMAEKIKEVLDE